MCWLNSLIYLFEHCRSVRWHEACLHVPAVIREILAAYESQLISDDDVERILDILRTQMCCLSVCAAAWLRYYIQVTTQNHRLIYFSLSDIQLTTYVFRRVINDGSVGYVLIKSSQNLLVGSTTGSQKETREYARASNDSFESRWLQRTLQRKVGFNCLIQSMNPFQDSLFGV